MFENGKCTNCGFVQKVDSERDAWICSRCGSPFIVEKAIINFRYSGSVDKYYGGNHDFVIRAGVLEKYIGSSVDVIIPRGVTHISGAFKGLGGLKSVIIPNSVVEIGKDAFCDCSSLTNIKIPDSVAKIGKSAFAGCSLKNVNIPESITCIPFACFAGCSLLESILIPHNVTEIGAAAFARCKNLENVVIEGKKIKGTFDSDGDLFYFFSPENNISISYSAFNETKFEDIAKNKCREEKRRIYQQREQWKSEGKCQCCGGDISFWNNKCKKCGRVKGVYF